MKTTYLSASIDEFCEDEIITIDSHIKCPSCGSLATPRILSGFHEICVGPDASYIAHCRCCCPTCHGKYTIDFSTTTDADTNYTSSCDIFYVLAED